MLFLAEKNRLRAESALMSTFLYRKEKWTEKKAASNRHQLLWAYGEHSKTVSPSRPQRLASSKKSKPDFFDKRAKVKTLIPQRAVCSVDSFELTANTEKLCRLAALNVSLLHEKSRANFS